MTIKTEMTPLQMEVCGIQDTGIKVYSTDNYDIFKALRGNRTVEPYRVKKIKDSINKVGYISNPIIVNEYMEVIDGQGRLAALKELQMPVMYIIVPGASVSECIAMNVNQTNWKSNDYIDGFAEQGNVNYIRLKKLMKEFPNLAPNTIANICLGSATEGGPGSTPVKSGTFVLIESRFNEVRNTLTYLSKFIPLSKNVKGRLACLYAAISFCYEHTKCNVNRLYCKFEENADSIRNIANTRDAIEKLEEIYNKQLPREGDSRIYFAREYENYKYRRSYNANNK